MFGDRDDARGALDSGAFVRLEATCERRAERKTCSQMRSPPRRFDIVRVIDDASVARHRVVKIREPRIMEFHDVIGIPTR